jgi:sugar lactone lactonase YvrE
MAPFGGNVKKTLLTLAVLLGAALIYLLAWPVPVEPVAWTPPPAPALEGPYAANDKLKAVERLAQEQGPGPEAIAFDAAGALYTGYSDGRVMRFDADGKNGALVVNTGGRPLGLKFGADGKLFVADAKRGLLQVEQGSATVLASEAGGTPINFADDLDVAADGTIYFSDASSKFGYPGNADFLEHGANGRLLRYDPATGKATVAVPGLHFPNGVALGPDDEYLVFNEQANYRVLRLWLKGDKKGLLEPLIENLPGLPDNVTYDHAGNRFWVALTTPRLKDLDQLLPHPFLRKMVFRLPAAVQPGVVLHGFVLAIDPQGKVVANLQDATAGAYAPVTSAIAHGDWLYLGSFTEHALARLPLAAVR